MLGNEPSGGDALEGSRRRAGRLAAGFGALVVLTFGLIVLGALVRAHGAGLACPDWPLCFGELLPPMDFKVAFEWTHRLVAGCVALLFAGLAVAGVGVVRIEALPFTLDGPACGIPGFLRGTGLFLALLAKNETHARQPPVTLRKV